MSDGRRRERAQRKGGGDGKRRKGEKVGQFVHVCAAQTVDNGTEVDGRPTALLMEQMKCGLTARWLFFFFSCCVYRQQAISSVKPSLHNQHGSDT